MPLAKVIGSSKIEIANRDGKTGTEFIRVKSKECSLTNNSRG